MKLLVSILALAMMAGSAASAGPASDAVRFFYTPPGYEPDPAVRDRFVDPAKAEFARNDIVSAGGETCFDWVLAIDGQDVDEAELARTLKLAETVTGDGAEVVATFSLFADQPDSAREVHWTLKRVGGDWKVSDIESRTGEWKLSALACGQ